MTEYGTQLLEKQKAKAVYGILERQLRSYYEAALRHTGDTGQMLGQLLETRLDNVVFRLGLAPSRSAARQAVTHGHVAVNGQKLSVPSYHVRGGDVIDIRERSQKSPLFQEYPKRAASADLRVPEWLAVEPHTFRGRVIRVPAPDELQAQPFRMQSIVEFYSR